MNPTSWLRAVSLFLLYGALPTLLSGCFGATALLAVFATSIDDSGGSSAAPRVFELDVGSPDHERPRADELERVEICFDLANAPESLQCEVEFSTVADCEAGSFRPAKIVPYDASPDGGRHTVIWNAAADGLAGYNEVAIRVTPQGYGSEQGDCGVFAIGNTRPVVEDVTVGPEDDDSEDDGSEDDNCEDGVSKVVSGNVEVWFTLIDTANDPSRILVFVDKNGEGFPDDPLPRTHISSLTPIEDVQSGRHGFFWHSHVTFPKLTVDNVVVGIQADDGLAEGVSQMAVSSPPFRVENNQPPEIIGTEPANNPDDQSPVNLQFTLRDRDEEPDPADVILQWSTERDSFPDVLRLIANVDFRRRVLADPAARAARRIITPRRRTVAEARLRVRAGSQEGPDEPQRQVVLWGLDPPATFAGGNLNGATIEFLSDGGAVEQTRTVMGSGTTAVSVLLDRELDPPGRPGQRVRIKDKESLLVDLATSRSVAGRGHSVPWDVAADAGLGETNAGYFVRATPVSGIYRGCPPFNSTLEKPIAAFPCAFDAGAAMDTGSRPTSVLGADLNADGALDLVSADSGSNQLSVFWGNGDGSFGETPTTLETGEAPSAVAAADLDGDGAPDLVSADSGSNQLSVFWGGGDREFSNPTIVPTDSSPKAVVAADLDGNGWLDLVSADSGADRLSVFFGRERAFDRRPTLTTGKSPRDVVATDLDGDGAVDLVSADSVSHQLSLYWGNGDGEFPERRTLMTGRSPRAVVATDLNADGAVDLASADIGSRQISIFLGSGHRGDGAFEELPSSPATGSGPEALAAVDVDGDGTLDLVSADLFSHQLSLFFCHGTRSFAANPATLATGAGPVAVVAADLNRDGALDVVSADLEAHQLSVFLGVGNGSFESKPALKTGDEPSALAAADVNADGVLDLIVALLGSVNQVAVFKGTGDGEFERQDDPLPTLQAPEALVAADLDGDGAVDLVSADKRGLSLSLFWGDGPGTFTFEPAPALGTGLGPVAVAAVDLNGDGALELVSADQTQGQLSVFWAAGGRNFDVQRFALPGQPSAVVACDVDADGELDLISARSLPPNRNELALVSLDDKGKLKVKGTLETGRDPVAVAVADLDVDGTLDVVSADSGSSRLSVFWGHGDGTFQASPTILRTGGNPVAVVTADLNGDGVPDLLSADKGSNRLTIFFALARRPLPPAFFGIPGPAAPTFGEGGGDLVLEARERPHRMNTSTGAIDGLRSVDFIGHAFHLDSLEVRSGAKVVVTGGHPLVLLVTGDVTIAGELLCDGESAVDAGLSDGRNMASSGGHGGPGGGPGGDGGGLFPRRPATEGGQRGGGAGGGSGGAAPGPTAGAGGGYGSRGMPGSAGRGGSTHGNDFLDPLFGGSGGGGGGLRERAPNGKLVDGGGGGGGGGGAVRITARGNITISGKLSAEGGNGGRGNGDRGGHGGGGSGGSILLQAYSQIVIEEGAIVSAEGGTGASGGSSPPAGDGGAGRIRFEDADGAPENHGTVLPPQAFHTGVIAARETRDSPEEPSFLRGDANADSDLSIGDAEYVLGFLFRGRPRLLCDKSADADDSGNLDLADAVFLLNFLFLGGQAPREPFPSCGEDPTADQLPCAGYSSCP